MKIRLQTRACHTDRHFRYVTFIIYFKLLWQCMDNLFARLNINTFYLIDEFINFVHRNDVFRIVTHDVFTGLNTADMLSGNTDHHFFNMDFGIVFGFFNCLVNGFYGFGQVNHHTVFNTFGVRGFAVAQNFYFSKLVFTPYNGDHFGRSDV